MESNAAAETKKSRGRPSLSKTDSLPSKVLPIPTELETDINSVNPKAVESKRKGLSGYMYFLKCNREIFKAELSDTKQGVAQVSKLCGERWNALSPEEKKKWSEDAKALPPSAPKEETVKQASAHSSCAIPISRIREICKLDPEVKAIKGDVVTLLTEATERFLLELMSSSLEKSSDKKRIKLIDVHHVIHLQDDKFGFLILDFIPPAQVESEEFESNKQKKQEQKNRKSITNEEDGQTKKGAITGYFSLNHDA